MRRLAAFSIFAATCSPDWLQMLSELTRVVKKDGRVIVAQWSDPTGFAGPSKILAKVFSQVFPDRPPLTMSISCAHTIDSLRKDLEDAGCEKVRVEEAKAGTAWPEPSLLVEELEPIFRFLPAYAALSDAERAKMKGPMIAAFAAHAAPDGTVNIPDAAFIATGYKTNARQ